LVARGARGYKHAAPDGAESIAGVPAFFVEENHGYHNVAASTSGFRHESNYEEMNETDRYKFITENTLDLICETTLDGFYTYLSSSYRDVLGYAPDELVGQHFAALLHPDDLDGVVSRFVEHARALTPGAATFRYRHKNGSWRWLETLGNPIKISEEISRAVFVSRDVTERKEAQARLRAIEERLRMVVNHGPIVLFATDKDGVLTLSEGKGLEAIGRRAGETVGTSIFDVIGAQPELDANIRRALAGEAFVGSVEYRGRLFETFYTPVCDDAGAIAGMTGVSIDVTESRAAQQALDEERLKRSKLESLAVLAGGIAHDFNNLLTGILGNLSLAQLDVPSGTEIAQRLSETEKASIRARDLVAQLLTFARGGQPIKKLMRAGPIIEQAAVFACRGSKVRCNVTIANDLWPAAVDEGQISQVLQNLVINAQQAMPAGGTVRVEAYNVPRGEPLPQPLPSGDYISITVSDCGVGIPQEHLGRIFEPYFTTKKSGHGLGLATAYSIVTNHGGLITVQSSPGIGTTFSIHLPAAPGSAVHAESQAHTPDRGRGKILVMDDEDLIRKLAGRMLTGFGYTVEYADEGQQAVDKFQAAEHANEPYDAVVLDLTVPAGLGGFEAFEKMRAIRPDVKAIISSGYSNDPVMAHYREFGIAAIVPKPYNVNELVGTVQNVVEGNGSIRD
jgi:PAS domain S-box-containing protein